MDYPSPLFWMAFGAVFLLSFLTHRNVALRNIFLLLASYAFITLWAGYLVAFLLYVTVVSFGAGRLIQGSSSRHRALWILWMTIALLLLPLLTYKFIPWIPALQLRWMLILPLGISFYTFQAIGYIADVYQRKTEATRDIVRYALFLAFFPKFIAGPIERTHNFLTQLGDVRPITRTHLSEGVFLIIWGLVQKLCIAETVLPYMNTMFTADVSSIQAHALSAPLALSLFVYADFSGYTDIARGTARLLGFDLLENFFAPYFSRNPREFWRRWHVSLSQWVRDYIYIPLGGSRGSVWKTNRNILITFAVIGLWHGLTLTFFLWGLAHGLLIVLHRAGRELMIVPTRIRRVLGHPVLAVPVLFICVTMTWILFFSQNIDQFLTVTESLGTAFLNLSSLARDANILPVLLLWVPVLLMDSAKTFGGRNLPVPALPRVAQLGFYVVCFYALVFLSLGARYQFLYGNF